MKFFQKKLAFICDLSYNNTCRRHVTKHSSIAQSVEHLTVNQAVVGSNPTRGAKWRVGQVVKTPPFHGGFTGSNPVRVTILIKRGVIPYIWALSSAGRASALQAECQRFDPVSAHHI